MSRSNSKKTRDTGPRRRTQQPRDISTIAPYSSSTEGNRSYKRHVAQKDYREMRRKRDRRKKIAIISAATIVFLLVAGVVGAWAYIYKINHDLRPDEGIVDQLVQTKKKEDPFWMILIGQDARPGETQTRSDTLMLAYVNPPDKKLTIISIPRDSYVPIPGHGSTKINAAAAYGGPPLTIQTVAEWTGLDISHYAEINFSDFRSLVDELGGVEVDVPVRINDRNAGKMVIEPGKQTLNGKQALTFCRSRKFPSGDFQRVKHQQIFLKALAKKVLSIKNPVKLTGVIAEMAKGVETDLKVGDLQSLASNMRGMDMNNIETVTVPGESKYISGSGSCVEVDEEEFFAMIERVKKGEPADAEAAAATKTDSSKNSSSSDNSVKGASDPASVKVVVRNGAGVSGVASQAQANLEKAKYKVIETGNANQFVYDETLVVYNDGGEANAKAIVNALGVGKPVASRGMYSFKGDILVVVGKDWKPTTK